VPIVSPDGKQTVDISINHSVDNVGVNVSGGADSAILLYGIAKFLQENSPSTKITVVTCSNDFKHRWNGRKAANVINFVADKLNFTNFDIHYNYYRDTQDVKYFHEVEQRLFDENRIDMLASGITQKPLYGDTTVENIFGKTKELRNLFLEGRESPNQIIWTEDKRYWNPFANVDKKMIAYLYDYYNVRDSLFSITRSCEVEPIEKFNKEFENKPCGHCWWCMERKWAFGEF